MDNGGFWKLKRSQRKLVYLNKISRRRVSISSRSTLRVKENFSEALWNKEESPPYFHERNMHFFFLHKLRKDVKLMNIESNPFIPNSVSHNNNNLLQKEQLTTPTLHQKLSINLILNQLVKLQVRHTELNSQFINQQ